MKKLFVLMAVVFSVSVPMHAKAAAVASKAGQDLTGSSLIINSIEMSDPQALLKAINHESYTAEDLKMYMLVARKKYDFLKSKHELWDSFDILGYMGIPLGAIIGAYLIRKAGARGAGDPILGTGFGAIAGWNVADLIEDRIEYYEKKVEKAQEIMHILQGALSKLDAIKTDDPL